LKTVGHENDHNAFDNQGETPLILAVKRNSIPLVEFLLTALGVNPNMPSAAEKGDGKKMYPLEYAMAVGQADKKPNLRLLTVLAQLGADPIVAFDTAMASSERWDIVGSIVRGLHKASRMDVKRELAIRIVQHIPPPTTATVTECRDFVAGCARFLFKYYAKKDSATSVLDLPVTHPAAVANATTKRSVLSWLMYWLAKHRSPWKWNQKISLEGRVAATEVFAMLQGCWMEIGWHEYVRLGRRLMKAGARPTQADLTVRG
jgi:hypothetical protein